MSALDILIAVIVLIGLWRGFQLGFVKSVIGLIGWFVALVAATRLASVVAPYMTSFVQSPVLQLALGFLVVVLVVIAAMHLLGLVFSSTLKALRLGFLDKLAGAVVGAGKNVLVVLVLMSIAAPLLVQSPIWQESVLAAELMPYAPMAKTLSYQLFGEAWNQVNSP